jgi:ABC-type lipoprotein release transport system permease subunit
MYRLSVTIRLGIQDLFKHIRLALVMALLIAVAVSVFAILETYRTGLADEFNNISSQWLVVQETQSFGEFYGSRLSSQVGMQLSELGASLVVPEIHVFTGTSIQNATLLRGIDLNQYQLTETFKIIAGRKLQSGDPSRLALIGSRLAENQHLGTGEIISLRGRNFTITGIFHTGTYADNEAWIALTEAQDLLGWGQDVSVYIIPDEGVIHEGDILSRGISVARRGEGMRSIAYQYQPIIDLMNIVALTLGAATILALANIFWRLAWLRRHELAILRTVGFPTGSLVGYLLAQASGVTMAGVLMSGFATLLFTTSMKLAVSGFTITPRLNVPNVLNSLGWVAIIVLAGSALPAWWLSHLNLAQLLHSE